MEDLIIGIIILFGSFIILVIGHITHKFNALIVDPFEILKYLRGNK